ncbi:CsgG/HfaB family protein [Brevundimonas sp. 357]|uniref:CsgG/HfaB family protein n=1 Tax=Brevundimonas sp. 357 TaxID=2555782 RepID=UPI000F78220E|nr:CsgG/HfaB family protein [Brevundimonas sp. 357]RSB43456.1 curli production assembly protein CsgG [Brevundimonas sp. 357]
MSLQSLLATFAAVAVCVAAQPSTAAAQGAVQAEAEAAARPGLKRRVAVGRFTNSTPYGRLLLSPGQADPVATQAGDMLVNALVASDHFFVFERSDLTALNAERVLSEADGQALSGVDALLLGSITQLGRRNEGKQGFLNSQRRQAVNATVEIRLVDVRTGRVFFTASGAGEATTETGEVAGFGSRAGYDSTLNDRAISAAIADTMTNIVNQLQQRAWFTDILRVSGSTVYVSGGPSQGLRAGDRFHVETPGETVVSGQSGLPITLPGSRVAQIEITGFFGDSAETEGATARVVQGELPQNISGLRVTEIRP